MKITALAFWLTLAGLVAVAPPSQAQPEPPEQGEFEVELRPSAAEVGDLIVATLTVSAPPQAIAAPVFPDWGESWGEAEVRATGPVVDTGRSRYRQEVTLAVFRTGEVVLPAVTVEVPTAEEVLLLESGPASLEIRSVLPPDIEDPEARPPAPPRELPVGDEFWRTALALVAACLVAAILLNRRRAQALRAETATVPPIEALAKGLESLRKVEDGVAFHTGLSLHLRRFLGRSFGFPALESTTTEVRQRLTDADIPRPLVSRTEKILRHCDLVKFARGALAPTAMGDPSARLDETLTIGGELDRLLHPPEPAAVEQGEQAA